MELLFCGANREVTGSCYAVRTKNATVVIDCGTFQGGKYAEDKNWLQFPFDPIDVDAVILTHAHFDHTGRLPKLYREGFRGKIWCAEATDELAMVGLRDSARLIEEEAERHGHPPLYLAADVEPLERLWRPVNYHQEVQIAPGIRMTLVDAGHILGSASIRLDVEGHQLAFSGDLGNSPVPLLRSTELLNGAEIVVIESTYGNRVHEIGLPREEILRDAIMRTVRQKGTLLIPAFALERTQELLYELHHLLDNGTIPKIPVFLDSPMAIASTDVFQRHYDLLNDEARLELRQGSDLFRFPGLSFTESSEESKAIATRKGAKIIIAGSGMMNGGRILHHLRTYLPVENTTLLIVGYQVEGCLGRQLQDGARQVKIYGDEIVVRADVRSFGSFSGHADFPRLMHWLRGIHTPAPSRVFVTHGELNSALSFSQSVEEQLNIASGVPEFGERIQIA